MYHDFQHSCIDIDFVFDSDSGEYGIVNDSYCVAAMLSAAVGPELLPLPVLIWGRTGLKFLKNRAIRVSTKQTKIICETQTILKYSLPT
jgi:hypothetical protein